MKYFILLLLLCAQSAFAGQIGIVISTQNGQLRRVIVPDSDAQLHQQNWAGPGETLLFADQSVDVTAEIQKFTGRPVTIPLAAVIDKNGLVKSTIVADPALDTSPDGQLIAAFPGVVAGQTFDLSRRVFIVPAHQETQAVLDADGNVLSTEIVQVPAADLAPVPLALAPSLMLTPVAK